MLIIFIGQIYCVREFIQYYLTSIKFYQDLSLEILNLSFRKSTTMLILEIDSNLNALMPDITYLPLELFLNLKFSVKFFDPQS